MNQLPADHPACFGANRPPRKPRAQPPIAGIALIAALAGCQPAWLPSGDDYVQISGGKGTARAWGISFDVEKPSGHATGSHLETSASLDPNQTEARMRLTLGDDVQIQLERTGQGPIRFRLNGKDCGTLEAGDRVEIDARRRVRVNRQPR